MIKKILSSKYISKPVHICLGIALYARPHFIVHAFVDKDCFSYKGNKSSKHN